MNQQSRKPADPLSFIKDAVRERRLYWTYHVNMRLAGRSIERKAIIESVDSYELVESYPDDKYLPSFLVLARFGMEAFHILFAVDLEGDNTRVITAYRPSLAEWETDLRRRKK